MLEIWIGLGVIVGIFLFFGILYAIGKNLEKKDKDELEKTILIKATLAATRRKYEPADITSIPQLFPFSFEISMDFLLRDNRFEYANERGVLMISG